MSFTRCGFAASLLGGTLAMASLPGCPVREASAAQGGQRNASPVSASNLDALSRPYLGTPYGLDCLGEGNGPDADPLFTRSAADCQTLVEQVMAEALAPHVGGLDAAVRKVRYRNGKVSLAHRLHYCIPDWISGQWPARDVTAEVAGKSAVTLRRTIDRPTFIRSRGTSPDGELRETVTVSMIPRAKVAKVASSIPDGSIGVFVLNKPGIVSGHLGFLFRRRGDLVLRHASQTRKRVIDEPLSGYLARAPRRFTGMMILQPVWPPARG